MFEGTRVVAHCGSRVCGDETCVESHGSAGCLLSEADDNSQQIYDW